MPTSSKYWPTQCNTLDSGYNVSNEDVRDENMIVNSGDVPNENGSDENVIETVNTQNNDDHQQFNTVQYELTSSSEGSCSDSSSAENASSSESSLENDSIQSSSGSESELSENEQNDSDDSDSGVKISPDVYNDCPINVDEGVLNLMNLFVKHKLEKVQLVGVLNSVLKFLPKHNNMPKTQYSLFKYVEDLCPLSKEKAHYYCSICHFYLGEVEMKCTLCNGECHKFYQLSLSEQIRNLFEIHGLADLIDKHSERQQESGVDANVLTDLCDGSEFKRAKVNAPYSLTLLGHADGISTSDSSDASLWPLEYVIVELPFYLRFKFVIVSGIWIDDSKPNLNSFMKPFVQEIQAINREGGVKWVHPKTKAEHRSLLSVPCFVMDAPARAGLQNILSHGGKHCCNICEQKMKKLPEEPVLPGVKKKRRRRVFTFEEEAAELRTAERMNVQATEAKRRQQVQTGVKLANVRGVRGFSVAAQLPGCDRSTMVFPEYMHLILCLMKEFLGLWFEVSGPWSLKDHIDTVNSFLANIKVPDFITRIPRPVDCFHQWKANELRSFLLYYSVIIFKKIMKDEYFQHWLLLVSSMYILLQDTVSLAEISRAEIMLQLFCRDFAKLYKNDFYTYYVHNIGHLALVVKRHGPLWSNSTFQLENFNGTLAGFIHGTRNIGKELVNNVRLAFGVEVLQARVNEYRSSNNEQSAVVEFRNKVRHYRFTDQEELLLSSNKINKTSVQLFFRAKTRNQCFTCSIYTRQKKRNNFTVCYLNSSNEKVYGQIKLFLKYDNVNMALVEPFTVNHCRSFQHTDSGLVIKHLIPIEKTTDIHLVEIGRLLFKVLRVEDFICIRPNRFEVNL